jgi:hypothetical protein
MPEITIDIEEPQIVKYYTDWAKQCAVYGKKTKDVKILNATFTDAYPFSIIKIDNTKLKVKLFYSKEVVE